MRLLRKLNKKKILFVGSYPDNNCGISSYTDEIIFELKKYNIFSIDIFKIFFLHNRIISNFKYFKLITLNLSKKYDFIHFQYTPNILGPTLIIYLLIHKVMNRLLMY